ncbi:MAG: type II methionyl aminopeptidase [Candidatus Diapherotrites archaeon]|nr:type II methionyl aminopeptidase [Candidatus Diapherotrites archaeon]
MANVAVDLDALRRAGKITERALLRAYKLLESGERNGLKIADAVESVIYDSDAKPAFPCNVSPDHWAAHNAPTDDRPTDLSGARLVKIDTGAHVDGWIGDSAFTFVFDEAARDVAAAAKAALEAAMHKIRPGVSVSDVGREISRVAKEYGVRPVSNLGGHQIDRFILHAGLFVPNVPEGSAVFQEGMVVAVEPFMSTGRGYVRNGPVVNIFSLESTKARSRGAKMVVKYVSEEFGPLPFAEKWVLRKFGRSARIYLYELAKTGSIYQYPILVDSPGSVVGQFETTFYVDKDGAEPLIDIFKIEV